MGKQADNYHGYPFAGSSKSSGRIIIVSDGMIALLIKLVEVDVIVNGGLIQADRNQYKPHGDGAFVCNSHGNPFFLFRISVCNLGIFIQELLKISFILCL